MLTCPKCRALLQPGTKACPYCSTDVRFTAAPSPTSDAEATTRLGLWILSINVVLYFLMILLDPAAGDVEGSRFDPTGIAVNTFGANSKYLVSHCGQYWRFVTAVFLHIDLLHIVLNSVALYILVPLAAVTFGFYRTTCLYLVTGFASSFVSYLFLTRGGSAGASGALCGLIGALAVYGWRRGGLHGRLLTRRMLGWAGLIVLFGLVPQLNIDNAGHCGGLVSGAALGYFAAAVHARGGFADRVWKFAAGACIGAGLATGAAGMLPNVVRSFEYGDMVRYQSKTKGTLERIDKVLRGVERAAELPQTYPDGPRGSLELRDAVQRALNSARRLTPEAQVDLDGARLAWDKWQQRVLCSHLVQPKALE